MTNCETRKAHRVPRVDNMGVGKVIRSENQDFKPGDYVGGYLGKCV